MVTIWNPLGHLVVSKQVQRPSIGFTSKLFKKGRLALTAVLQEVWHFSVPNDCEVAYLETEG